VPSYPRHSPIGKSHFICLQTPFLFYWPEIRPLVSILKEPMMKTSEKRHTFLPAIATLFVSPLIRYDMPGSTDADLVLQRSRHKTHFKTPLDAPEATTA
jgi:hypothetical protein